ncbi:hypothetical protein, partial [Piscinibacter sp.]|uniref:hypothetical protein n=1 Tax=Piscinibacter sp. TaxID=1903157 RepID=UPI0035595FA0
MVKTAGRRLTATRLEPFVKALSARNRRILRALTFRRRYQCTCIARPTEPTTTEIEERSNHSWFARDFAKASEINASNSPSPSAAP